ncbi:transposase [Streptomyces sp. NPDC008086]|uniref:transposase n=1 Tax=Streptomyces sp. NPDC008086 TaxID=3364807 RepID=UPI0036E4D8AC
MSRTIWSRSKPPRSSTEQVLFCHPPHRAALPASAVRHSPRTPALRSARHPRTFAAVSCFRAELYACLTAGRDALFELCDASLCTDGPVRTLVDLALAPERRGQGALYGGLNQGRIDVARLRRDEYIPAHPLNLRASTDTRPVSESAAWLNDKLTVRAKCVAWSLG